MTSPLRLEELIENIPLEDAVESKFLLASLRPSEIAHALESTRPTTRRVIWQLLEEDGRNQTLQHMNEIKLVTENKCCQNTLLQHLHVE